MQFGLGLELSKNGVGLRTCAIDTYMYSVAYFLIYLLAFLSFHVMQFVEPQLIAYLLHRNGT